MDVRVVCRCGKHRDFNLHKNGWIVAHCRYCGDSGKENNQGDIRTSGLGYKERRYMEAYGGRVNGPRYFDPIAKVDFAEIESRVASSIEDNAFDVLKGGLPSPPRSRVEETNPYTKEELNMFGEKVIQVKFNCGSKPYSYFTDLDLEVGDLVVVEANDSYEVTRVSKIKGLSEDAISRAGKWVVQKVDLQAHEDKRTQRELTKEIRNKLRERKKMMEDIVIYKQLSETDPEIKKLLAELEAVSPGSVPQLDSGKDEKTES